MKARFLSGLSIALVGMTFWTLLMMLYLWRTGR